MTEIAKCWFCGEDCFVDVCLTVYDGDDCPHHSYTVKCSDDDYCGYELPGRHETKEFAILAHNNPPGVDAAKRKAYIEGAKSGWGAAMLKMGVNDGE
jgi:hypothetical protein